MGVFVPVGASMVFAGIAGNGLLCIGDDDCYESLSPVLFLVDGYFVG